MAKKGTATKTKTAKKPAAKKSSKAGANGRAAAKSRPNRPLQATPATTGKKWASLFGIGEDSLTTSEEAGLRLELKGIEAAWLDIRLDLEQLQTLAETVQEAIDEIEQTEE